MCSSPWLFAACHVFHRLPVPRHPPCALSVRPLFFVCIALHTRSVSFNKLIKEFWFSIFASVFSFQGTWVIEDLHFFVRGIRRPSALLITDAVPVFLLTSASDSQFANLRFAYGSHPHVEPQTSLRSPFVCVPVFKLRLKPTCRLRRCRRRLILLSSWRIRDSNP